MAVKEGLFRYSLKRKENEGKGEEEGGDEEGGGGGLEGEGGE